jgi:hypothetical protein
MKIRGWLVLLGISAALVAVGIFFARQDLGTADEYASVASFFLALVGAAASVVSRLRSREQTPEPAEPRSGAAEGDGSTHILLMDNDNVMIGPDNVMNVSYTVDSVRGRRRRK